MPEETPQNGETEEKMDDKPTSLDPTSEVPDQPLVLRINAASTAIKSGPSPESFWLVFPTPVGIQIEILFDDEGWEKFVDFVAGRGKIEIARAMPALVPFPERKQ